MIKYPFKSFVNLSTISTTLFLALLIILTKCNEHAHSNLICASSFLKENRSEQVVNCLTTNLDLKIKINFECQVRLSEKVFINSSKAYDIVKSTLILDSLSSDTSILGKFKQATFFWEKLQAEQEHRHQSNKTYSPRNLFEKKKNEETSELANKINITFSQLSQEDETKNGVQANLVLYDILPELVYKICVQVDDLISKTDFVCCEIERLEEEEDESRILMSLLVIGVILLIYLIIILIYWKCNPTNFEEILEQLPSTHVNQLKNLKITDPEIDAKLGDGDSAKDNIERYLHRRMVTRQGRKSINLSHHTSTGFENESYEDDLDEQENKIVEALKFEANRLRRMSQLSTVAIDLKEKPERPAKSVKFAETHEHIEEDEERVMRMLHDRKRRASVKPFKKVLDLELSSDSD
jgi:hypothetical protein